jgi:ANCHR-like B-box zinc-binding protein
MADNSKETALWARLNALKLKSQASKSTISDLQARFKALKGDDSRESSNTQPTGSEPPPSLEEIANKPDNPSSSINHEEDEDVGAMLEELGSTGDFGLSEVENVDGLLAEANRAVKAAEKDTPDPLSEDQAGQKGNEDADERSGHAKSDAGDSEAADEYIQQLLAEVSLDDKEDPVQSDERTLTDDEAPAQSVEHEEVGDKSPKANESESRPLGLLDLPSTPQVTRENTKSPPAKRSDADDELEARLAALTDGNKQKNSAGNIFEAQSDEDETENWCIICYDDATVKCYGCDGDLYCTKCWKEGHTGPDAGLEERRHRAAAFKKDTKKKKSRARVAA